jgi:hypothetical protein
MAEVSMPIKRVICPERLRQIPAHFSWVDHRLVRERYIDRCDACAAALYLFLVTVADAQGLSYYADATLARHLSMAPARLEMARRDLIRVGLIAWQRPLYQVLSLDTPAPEPAPPPQPQVDVATQIERLHAALGRRHA